MKNSIVGTMIMGIAVLIGLVIFLFNRALTQIVNSACVHGVACPMWGTINFQTNISLGIMGLVLLIGLYLLFFGKEERIITKTQIIKEQVEPKKITKENYEKVMGMLAPDERLVLTSIIEANGTIFQSDLAEKTNFTKVKVTRVLDKLEGRHIIERKRRGMTNVIILSYKP
ncbi:MarR family transcriptional regulator [archaeon]|nr:MarR family transcriptional regulator [archaeon]